MSSTIERTQIQNERGVCVSGGKNLAVIYSNARRRQGWKHIRVLPLKDSRYAAMVTVYFGDGFRAITNFADLSICKDWAANRAKRSGCTVSIERPF